MRQEELSCGVLKSAAWGKIGWVVVALAVLLVVILIWPAREASQSQVEPMAMDGHARMVAVLREIAENPDNKFFGDSALKKLRSRLESVPAGGREEIILRSQLGSHELRLGNTEEAIVQLKSAYQLVASLKDEVPESVRRLITYDLAIAYLRLGENENCVNCHTSESCLFPIQGSGVHVKREGSSQAVIYLEELLETNPDDASARWLLNVAYMTLGKYPDGVPARHRIAPATFDSEEAFPRFKDIAQHVGLNTTSLSGGAIAEDFDDDGFLEIVTSDWDLKGQLRLFKHNGEGNFTEATVAAGLTGIVGGLNLIQADYDTDGHTDILVLRGAWLGEAGRHPNSLLRNHGNGTFTDVTFDAGLAEDNRPTQTATWLDYDNDGRLDLFVGNEIAPSQLFHNEGNGTFTDVAARAGVTNNRYAKAVTAGDFDGDALPDVYVSNFGEPNRLYRNNGDGTFTDVAPRLAVDRPYESFTSWFWDFNNDGHLDLFVSSYRNRDGVGAVAKSFLAQPIDAELARLYQGDGRGGFREVASSQNLKQLTVTMGGNFGDLDNDGFLDFYLGTGYPDYEALMPNAMYRNRRGKGFANVTTAGGFGHLQKGHAVVFADLDNDGDQDVFEQMGGALPGDAYGDVLFQNPGFGNYWIKVKLVGKKSNRSAIGARIKILITENGKSRAIYRHVNSGGSFGANPLRQHIGLGKAERVDVMEIFWPTSGLKQVFRDIDANINIELTEGERHYKTLPLKSAGD